MERHPVLAAISQEFARHRSLAERAVEQLDDAMVCQVIGDSSIAMYVAHIGGNLASRFMDFLTADGEKPWRDRDREFDLSDTSLATARRRWLQGWTILNATLESLDEADFDRTVRIRGLELTVAEALARSLAHTAYHVGQIVLLAKILAGDRWETLSIPRGGSESYNVHPDLERG